MEPGCRILKCSHQPQELLVASFLIRLFPPWEKSPIWEMLLSLNQVKNLAGRDFGWTPATSDSIYVISESSSSFCHISFFEASGSGWGMYFKKYNGQIYMRTSHVFVASANWIHIWFPMVSISFQIYLRYLIVLKGSLIIATTNNSWAILFGLKGDPFRRMLFP